jgi:hypothetical protein
MSVIKEMNIEETITQDLKDHEKRQLSRTLFDNYAREKTDRLMKVMRERSVEQNRVNELRKVASNREGFTPQESMRLEYFIPEEVYHYWKLVYGEDFSADNPDSWKLLKRIAKRYKISENQTPDKYLEPPKDLMLVEGISNGKTS